MHGSVANSCFRVSATETLVTVVEDAVSKGRHFDRSVILLCVRWYLAFNLKLRNLEEMMDERSISVDHATVDRWVLRYAPELLKRFNARNRAVTGKCAVNSAAGRALREKARTVPVQMSCMLPGLDQVKQLVGELKQVRKGLYDSE